MARRKGIGAIKASGVSRRGTGRWGFLPVGCDIPKLRVCFLAGTLGQGGAERQLLYMLRALRQNGASPALLCLTRGEFWEDHVRRLGIPVTCVGRQASKAVRLGRILIALRKDRPDVVQSQHFYSNLYVVAAARALGVREVGAMRSDGINDVRRTGTVLGRLSLRAPRLIAANSKAAIRNAIAMGVPAARLHHLPNVVDTEEFKPAGERRPGPVRLVFVGSLVSAKRHDRFLAVVARLRRQLRLQFQAVVAGAGPQRSPLQRQAAKLGLLPGVVEFLGAVSDIGAVYRDADVLVLTSDWEGTPNVVLEAMASGLPVVATRVGDLPEIVRHGETGYLADPDDEESLVDALSRLVCDPSLRTAMGRRAREYVRAHHSLERLPGFLEDLYKVALS